MIKEILRRRICGIRYKFLRGKIIRYLEKQTKNGIEDYAEILDYLKNDLDKKLSAFPYSFSDKYSATNISVCRDETGFPYVLHGGRKLYGKKNWRDFQMAQYYNGLRIEQDEESPHRYLFPNRMPKKGDILADIGAAEGIFTLDVIGTVGKAYLFECDDGWIDALRLTFADEIASGKVEIVRAFVGDRDESERNTLSLDTFFAGKRLDYVKADIEGAEEAMLSGGEEVFTKKAKQCLLCCYHRQEAEEHFRKYFTKKNFSRIEVNKHWMIWYWQYEVFGKMLEQPYIRHAVFFAGKE